jgi:hypothetical protein
MMSASEYPRETKTNRNRIDKRADHDSEHESQSAQDGNEQVLKGLVRDLCPVWCANHEEVNVCEQCELRSEGNAGPFQLSLSGETHSHLSWNLGQFTKWSKTHIEHSAKWVIQIAYQQQNKHE